MEILYGSTFAILSTVSLCCTKVQVTDHSLSRKNKNKTEEEWDVTESGEREAGGEESGEVERMLIWERQCGERKALFLSKPYTPPLPVPAANQISWSTSDKRLTRTGALTHTHTHFNPSTTNSPQLPTLVKGRKCVFFRVGFELLFLCVPCVIKTALIRNLSLSLSSFLCFTGASCPASVLTLTGLCLYSKCRSVSL